VLDDNELMAAALEQARLAATMDEVPVGCVIARGGEIISATHNRRMLDGDPVAHAEILAIRQAAERIGDWRLEGCTMAVTLEPCCMCAGAIVLSRIERLIYGADDPKAGAVKTLYEICSDPRLNHRAEVISGVMSTECGEILTKFFRTKRQQHQQDRQ